MFRQTGFSGFRQFDGKERQEKKSWGLGPNARRTVGWPGSRKIERPGFFGTFRVFRSPRIDGERRSKPSVRREHPHGSKIPETPVRISGERLQTLFAHPIQHFKRSPARLLFAPLPLAHQVDGNVQIPRENFELDFEFFNMYVDIYQIRPKRNLLPEGIDT